MHVQLTTTLLYVYLCVIPQTTESERAQQVLDKGKKDKKKVTAAAQAGKVY